MLFNRNGKGWEPSRDLDPEKGDSEKDENDRRSSQPSDNPDDNFEEDEEEHNFEDDVPQNTDDGVNEIIRQVDFERPDDDGSGQHDGEEDDESGLPTPKGRRFRRFSSISTLGSTVSTAPSNWWTRFKEFVNPKDKDDIDDFIPNYRHTPIISGVIIPFSILLEIPGLTEHWYIRTDQNQTVETQKNPVLLDVGMGLSMTCAVAANIFLVLRFLEIRVKTMTIICIAFLTAHDVINVIIVTVFGVQHRFDDGFTYGQSFWLTTCSTVASLFTNITLIWDLYRIPDFSKSGSGLTRRQRSLVIIVIILMSYIALGALINSLLLHLSFINGLYFTVVSIETIGFGDITPKTTGARVFVCFYVAIGIVNIGLAVSMTRETVLEGLEVGYRKRVKSMKDKRKEARKRRRVERRWREAIEWRLRDKGELVWVKVREGVKKDRGVVRRVLHLLRWHRPQITHWNHEHGHHHGMHLNLDALSPSQLEAAALEAGVPLAELLPKEFILKRIRSAEERSNGDESVDQDEHGILERLARGSDAPDANTLTHARMGKMVAMLGRFALAVHGHGAESIHEVIPIDHDHAQEHEHEHDDNVSHHSDHMHTATVLPATGVQPRQDLTQSYESFRAGMEREERRAFYARLTVACSLFILFWVVGSAIFSATEGWSYGTAIYFCFISFTTIGYGDLSPETPAGRSVFVVWALLGVGTMTILISILSEAYSTRYKNALHTHTFENAVKRYKLRTRSITVTNTPPTFIAGIDRPAVPLPSQPLLTGTTAISFPPTINSAPIRTTGPPLGRTRTISIARPPSIAPAEPEPPRPPSPSPSERARETQQAAQEQLEALPLQVLQHARTFHEHVQYFVGPGKTAMPSEKTGGFAGQQVPDSLRNLLEEITGADRIGERMKEEIFQDEDARHTLFTLSIEKSLMNMIEAAEQALGTLAQRNAIAAQHQPRPAENARETTPTAIALEFPVLPPEPELPEEGCSEGLQRLQPSPSPSLLQVPSVLS